MILISTFIFLLKYQHIVNMSLISQKVVLNWSQKQDNLENKMVMEKSWNMTNWPKVMEFCYQSWNFTNFAPNCNKFVCLLSMGTL